MTVRERQWRGKDGRVRTTKVVDFVFTHANGTKERIRKRSPVQTRRGAEAYEREVRNALLQGTYRREETEPEGQQTAPRPPRFDTFSDQYLRAWATPRNKRSTLQDKKSHLRKRLGPRFGRFRIDRIGTKEIDMFTADMLEEEIRPNTINNYLRTLGDMLSAALEWGYISRRPKIRKLKTDSEFDFLEFAECDRLLEAATGQGRTMILVAVRTGLRRGELIALRWEDVDLVAGRLLVRFSATRGVVDVPKSGHGREVPLSRQALRALKAHRHLQGKYVFCRDDGRMLNQDDVPELLHAACRRAGLRKVGWHVLRHTFASHLVMRGEPLKSVQELLGHASITTTMRYAHLSPNVRRDAVNHLDAPAPRHGTYVAHDGAPKSESRLRGG